MNHGKPTVVIIKETNRKYDYDSVKHWFDLSSYNACEADDLFEAFETASDFTGRTAPDVVLVCMKPGPQFDTISKALDADRDYFELPVAIVSDMKHADEKRAFSFGSLKVLKGRLDVKPAARAAKATVASR
jgi:hypothetical protein